MTKVTFSTTPVVSIEIKGEGERGEPRARDDDGLVRSFLQFLESEGIFTAAPTGHSGAGSYHAFFTADDAAKIEVWLESQGATRVDPLDH